MYFVLAPDGQKYGPADEATLQSWIDQGRLQPTTVLEDAATRMQFPASSLPGLRFAAATPPVQQAAPGPYDYSQPRQQNFDGHYQRGPTGISPGEPLPSHYRKFNWGAFFFTWIWGLNHKKPILLALLGIGILSTILPGEVQIFINLATLGAMIWVGTQGNQWAWESGRFHSPDEMQRCQTIWGWWALGVFLATCALYAMMFAFLGVAFMNMR